MKIQDIMTRDPSSVTADATVREAAQVMKRENVGIVPVVAGENERRLVGLVTDRDIAIRCIAEGKDGTCRVRDVMSADDLATCNANDDVENVMSAMRSEKVRRIPIVDERGSLVGIVSQADVLLKTRDTSRAGETVEQISEPGGRHAH
ncbi:MAG TPA: CBS domain-containing protein [Gemmatimonadaceae bacterium]|jgi:CBS domain-containing protein|nr:CBS domain-containing protein [Gemmatimonadaceae bacterium]